MAPQVQEVTRDQAAQALTETPVRDPRGRATPESLAAHGTPVQVLAEGGSMVCVLRPQGNRLWIDAAAGAATENLTQLGLQLAEETARQSGLAAVCFETARPGLVRVAQQHGYRITGWIMEKDVE